MVEQINPMQVYDFAMQGVERGRQSKLAKLIGQAYQSQDAGQRQGLLGQAAQLDPASAMQAGRSMGDDLHQQIARRAAMIASAPASMRPQLYAGMPELAVQAGFPMPPQQWDEQMLPMMQQMGGALADANNVQSRFIDANGNVMALMRDGSVKDLGIKADPNTQIIEGAGGFYGVNKRNLSAQPVQIGGAPQAAPQQPAMQQVQYATEDGQPIPASEQDAFLAAVREDQQSQGRQLQAAPPKVSPVQMAQLQLAQQAGARDQERLRMAQDAARQKAALPGATTGGVNAQKLAQANATKLAQFNTAERAINRLEQAANSIATNSFFDGGPMDKYVLGKLPQGQELEQAGASLLPVLTALTRVPGVGAQSDLESRLAALQMPSAEFPPEVNKRAVQALREYMRDLKSALQAPAAASAPASDIDALLDKYK